MTDPKVHGIIFDALASFINEDDLDGATNAVVGALAVSGFAIIAVDADVMRRVVSEMTKK